MTREEARIVPSTAPKGGFDIIYRGCVSWARTLPLAYAVAEAVQALELEEVGR